jgi:hypothetical protein
VSSVAIPTDRRGSAIPTVSMITTRFMELRRRRGLMVTLALVTVGIPTVFLAVRLLLHAISPHTYGPAGGYDIFTALTAGVLYTFGFIVAATLGCTAGSVDLTEGMFRHLVVTGRSRIALYLARVPAGLAIIVPLVAIGFSIVCAVCVYAAPSQLSYDGLKVPAGLSQTQLESFAASHATEVICDLPYNNVNVAVPCRGPGLVSRGGPGTSGPSGPALEGQSGHSVPASAAQVRAAAIQIARLDYSDYKKQFRVPPVSVMVKTGLWLELEAVIGFLVGLGLGSLIGQRTVALVLMIVLEIILTPIIIRVRLPHLVNLQRAVVGSATARLEPSQLPLAFGGGGHDYRLPETTTTAVIVILAWVIGWTVLGAWRMRTRDA